MKSKKKSDRKFYRPVCCLALVFGSFASGPLLGQTNSASPSTNVTTLDTVTVVGHLNEARSAIVPNLGATAYSFSPLAIVDMAQGDDASFNQVILRAPGVAEDSLGQLHVRGEHANLQYRINDVVLPEGITGFGQELDPRFVQSMQMITGSLPAEYGFRTAGIIDIQTKGGALHQRRLASNSMAAATTPSGPALNTPAPRANGATSLTAATRTTTSASRIRPPVPCPFTITPTNIRPSCMRPT